MAINLENELKTISVQLKSLSMKVDKIATGIMVPKKTKRKSAIKKGAYIAGAPTDKNDIKIIDDHSSVLVHGAGELESEVSPDLK